MKILAFPIIFVILFSITFGVAYAETLPTDKGTLNVDLVVEYPMDNSQTSKLKIDFLNPVTGKIQEHIDYRVFILDESSNYVFGPIQLTHTSLGSVTIPVEIKQDVEHRVVIEIEGILFQPIDLESVTFAIGGSTMPTQPPEGGGCLIATATYGSELAPQVQQLRQVRSTILENSNAGSAFMESFNVAYYAFSPTIADFEREHEHFREMLRVYLTPMIVTLSIMEHADSEIEVLAYGIGTILLNIFIYIVAPITIITLMYKKISKRIPVKSYFNPNNA